MVRSTLESDEDLVRRARSGESDAFGRLVTRYQQRVFRLVSRLISNPTEAEDVVQETFIKAFYSLEGFRGDAMFYTWLYRVAINVAKNELREIRKRAFLHGPTSAVQEEGDETVANAADSETPESILAAKQVAELITKALENIPTDFRTALTLREIDGLSYEEISVLMACPVGTVRSRISRARELIALKLAGSSLGRNRPNQLH